MEKIRIADEELDAVNGGKITYTWDGNQGSIGLNGYNPFTLLNKDAFVEYYNANKNTKSDAEILQYLLAHGYAKTN